MPLAKLEAFENTVVDLAGFAKALGHPARIFILQYLAGRGEVPAMDIVAAVPLSQPACSRHVGVLHRAGLVKSRVSGSKVYFRLDQPALTRLRGELNRALGGGTEPDA